MVLTGIPSRQAKLRASQMSLGNRLPVLKQGFKTPCLGWESSNQLLLHVDPQAKFFACFDTILGYHQVAVDEESSNLLIIVTQMGNYRYQVLGQGICSSQDLFNYITDGGTKLDPDFQVLKILWSRD